MIRRPAVTLMEVLVTMFIMAIGMLALLALFPLGAVSMAQALKDDRCASAASMAEQFAIAMNVRHDPNVTAKFTPGTSPNVPSNPVYVDPYGVVNNLPQLGTSAPQIPRTLVSYVIPPTPNPNNLNVTQMADRWFTLPNDITFTTGGFPDTGIPLGSTHVERGREYSWAYLLQRPQANNHDAVNLTVVVYHKRSTAVPEQEQTYTASGSQYGSGLVLQWNPATQSPNLKRGIWLLDTTPTVSNPLIPRAMFYRVVNVSDSTSGYASLDVQPNLANAVTQVVLMSDVAEVFQKGTSWQP